MGIWDSIKARIGGQPNAHKSFNALQWTSLAAGGVFGRNQDIDATKAGYALAQFLSVPVYRAVNARMVAVAGLVWELVTRDGDNLVYRSDMTQSGNHFVRAINRETQALGYDMFGLWQMQKCLTGEAYFQKVTNQFGYPAGVEMLNAVYTTPQVAGGRITGYMYTGADGAALLAPDEVIYDRYPNAADVYRGLSPVQVALDSINVDRNANRFFLAFFRNNASLGKVISGKQGTPLTDGDVAFINNWMRENATGVANSFKTLLSRVPLNIDHQPIPDMTQPIELVDWFTRSIYSAFGVSRSVAGDTDGSRYQASPQDMNWFYLNTVIPEARRMAQVVNTQLIPFLDPAADYYFRFDLGAWEAVNESEQRRADRAVALYSAGVLTLNEVRSELGYHALADADILQQSDDTDVVDEEHVSDAVDDTDIQPVKAARYSHIDFKPTPAMAEEAKRGLAWRREYGRGGTEVGVARARDISNRVNLSPETVRRMKAYFDRHEVDKQGAGWERGSEGYPSAGRIAWALWGGDVGYSWARARVEQMNAADNAGKGAVLEIVDNRPAAQKAAIDGHAYPVLDVTYTLEGARDEIKAWYKFVLRGNKRAFKPVLTWGDAYDAMVAAHQSYVENGDKDALRSVYQRLINQHTSKMAQLTLAWRAAIKGVKRVNVKGWVEDSDEEFTAGFAAIVEDFVNGVIDARTAYNAIMELIRVFAAGMLEMGAREAGQPVTPAIEQQFENMMNEQTIFVLDYLQRVQGEVNAAQAQPTIGDVIGGAAVGGAAGVALGAIVDGLTSQIGLWFDNSVMPFLNLAWSLLTGDKMLEFVGEDGVENCATCKRLKGQRHRKSEWLSRGFDPKDDNNRENFECKLWNCQHYLTPTNAKSRGSW